MIKSREGFKKFLETNHPDYFKKIYGDTSLMTFSSKRGTNEFNVGNGFEGDEANKFNEIINEYIRVEASREGI